MFDVNIPCYTCQLHKGYDVMHTTELWKLLSLAALRSSETSTGYPDCMVGQVRVGILRWKKVLYMIFPLWLFSLRKLDSEYFWASENLQQKLATLLMKALVINLISKNNRIQITAL